MLTENRLQLSKNWFGAFARAIGIHPGEGLPTALLLGQSFGLGVMLAAMFTAANSIFLAEFGADALAYIYIIAAVVNITGGAGFAWLEHRLSFSWLLISTLIFLAGSILLLRIGLGLTGIEVAMGGLSLAGVLVFALPVWLRLVWVLSNLVLWTLAGRLFDVRQSKRLFTLIMAGAIFAIIITGLVISPVIEWIGPSNLLFIASGCLAVVLGLLLLTIYYFRDQVNGDRRRRPERTSPRNQWRTFLRSRYILLIFSYTVLSTLGTYILDFAFFAETRARYPDLNALAKFLGNYMGMTTLVMLFVALAAGPIISRYGVKLGLWANPALVAMGVFSVIVMLILFGPMGLIFWPVVFTKASDDILVSATTNTSVRILYQPLPANQQVPLQTTVESIITPLSMGLAGVILLLLQAMGIFSTLPIILLLFFILIGWLGASLLLSREYNTALKQALARRHFTGEAAPLLADKSSLEVVQQALTDDQPEVVIYALTILEENNPETLPQGLPTLLAHPQSEIRLDALRRIERLNLSGILPAVQQLLKTEAEPRVIGAAIRALSALKGPEFLPEAEAYLRSSNSVVQRDTLVGLLRYGGIEGMLFAGQRLLQLLNSAEPNERILAAELLAEAELYTYYHPLKTLLADESIPVRQAALRAAGNLGNPALWPSVAQGLTLAETRPIAADVLSAGGEPTLPALAAVVANSRQDRELLIAIARIAGRIKGDQAIALLRPHVAFPEQAVRTEFLRALGQCGYQAEDGDVSRIQTQLNTEASQAAWILAALVDLGEGQAVAPLQEALHEALAQIRERLFYLLSFLYDSQAILQAKMHLLELNGTSSKKKANALEIIDVLLDRKRKQLIFPLLDNSAPVEQRLKRLTSMFPQPHLSQSQRLEAILQPSDSGPVGPGFNRWTKACALYTAGLLQLDELAESIVAALNTPDPLLKETAAHALSRLDPDLAHQTALSQSDPAGHQGDKSMLSTIERVLFLKSAEIFNRLSGEELVWVARVARQVCFSPGEQFIRQGDPGDCLYIIVSGRVEVVLDNGKKITTLREKNSIGEMTIFSRRPRIANCLAATPVTALKIDRQDFQALLAEKSELALDIIQILVQRLEKTMQPSDGLE